MPSYFSLQAATDHILVLTCDGLGHGLTLDARDILFLEIAQEQLYYFAAVKMINIVKILFRKII